MAAVSAAKLLALVLAALLLLAVAAWAWLRGPEIPYAALAARYGGPGSSYVDLPGAIRLHYRDQGNPAGPALVLVHGFGDSATTWEPWVAALGSHYHLYSLDLPGHGLTEAPAGYLASPTHYLEVLAAFAAARAPARFALAGNSMGGELAWRYALKDPEHLSALILVDAAGWPLTASGKTPLAFRLLRYRLGRYLLARIDNRPLIEQGLRFEFGDPRVLTPQFLDRWAEFQRAPGHREILMSFAFGELGQARASALATLRVPTLVLHGDRDPLIPLDHGRRFATAIPGAQLIVYPGVGHLPQLEIGARSAADVAAFLAANP